MKLFFLFIGLSIAIASPAQEFIRLSVSQMVEVKDYYGQAYTFPFAGGLMFPLFNSMDVNSDGSEELIVLDRADNRLLVFENMGIKDSASFLYNPVYEKYFPYMERTLLIRDYNHDGKKDLFTFSLENNAGLTVYKNVSKAGLPAFKKIYEPLNAIYFGQPSMLYVNSIDLPVIQDVDGDGDLDILNFFILGTFVDYFENLAYDKYGKWDSLIFEYASQCWGKFKENDTSNSVILGLSCSPVRVDNSRENTSRALRHVGSAMFLKDMDHDGDQDLILSDVGYPVSILLVNGKTEYKHPEDSMIFQHDFPENEPVRIKQMPGFFEIDLNNDGIQDLIASPMDDQFIDTFQSLNQIWAYINTNSNEYPDYHLSTQSFLQNEMVDLGGKTAPLLIDVDADGDKDLLVATAGDFSQTFYQKDFVVFFENTGSSSLASFQLKDSNFLHFDTLHLAGLSLTQGDLDGDGDIDILFGQKNGQIGWLENTAGPSKPLLLKLKSLNAFGIDVGQNSHPLLTDIDGDSSLDLLISNEDGQLFYYRNQGNLQQPAFTLVTDSFGGVRFKPAYRESPVFTIADLNQDGEEDLLAGTSSGDLLCFSSFRKGLSSSLKIDTFPLYDPALSRLQKKAGKFLVPCVGNLDGDHIPDLLLGCNRGGLMFFGSVPDTVHFHSVRLKSRPIGITGTLTAYPNPCSESVQIRLPLTEFPVNVVLRDITGKMVYSSVLGRSDQKIQLRSLPEGIYLLQVTSLNKLNIYNTKLLIVNSK